jgi:hypothetical protein
MRIISTQHIAAQMAVLRYDQGRIAEIADLVRGSSASLRYNSGWRAGFLVILCESGAHDEARAELARWEADGFVDPAEDQNGPSALNWLAAACLRLAEARRAEHLYARFLPYSGRNAVNVLAAVCYGSADRPLGELALAAGRLDDAERHLQRALDANTRLGARPFVARTEYALARLLLTRRGPGDEQRAGEILARCVAAAEQLGMAKLAEELRR